VPGLSEVVVVTRQRLPFMTSGEVAGAVIGVLALIAIVSVMDWLS
jgi:hypothetical protein